MKRDLLADLSRAFLPDTLQDSPKAVSKERTAIIAHDGGGNLEAVKATMRGNITAEIIRKVFADYENEEHYEIPWV